MTKKLSARALAKLEANRDIWQEVLDGVSEIKAGRGKRTTLEPRSPIARARLKSGLTQAQFAALLGVSQSFASRNCIPRCSVKSRRRDKWLALVRTALAIPSPLGLYLPFTMSFPASSFSFRFRTSRNR
jgi:hypothetical protein